MEHIPNLLGFPIEVVALALVCWTAVEITKLIVGRKSETIEIKKPKETKEEQSPDK